MQKQKLNEQRILDELIALLETRGVKTRREHLDESSGGLCKIQGKKVLFLNKHNSSNKQALVCAEALLQVVDIDGIYIRPDVRQFIKDLANNK